MLKDIRNLLNGTVYGMTLIIPGVSATIFAIILGFYDELIHTVNHFKEDYRKNIRYLAVFIVGVAVGAVVFSSVVLFLLANHSLPTMLLFMGLLAGIIPLLALKAKGATRRIAPREVVLAVVSMLALIALSRAVPAPTAESPEYPGAVNVVLLLLILLAGFINGATLLIPGLSGAFLLLIMGLYPLIIHSISSVGTYIGDPGNFALLQDTLIVLAPFGIGGIIGCIGIAKLMEKLLRDYHEAVYAVILGLVLGSIVVLALDPIVYQSGISAASIVIGIVMFFAGGFAAFIMGKRCEK